MRDPWVPMSDEIVDQSVTDTLNYLNEGYPGWLEAFDVTNKGIYGAMAYVGTLINDDNPQAAMATATFFILAKIALERGLIEGHEIE